MAKSGPRVTSRLYLFWSVVSLCQWQYLVCDKVALVHHSLVSVSFFSRWGRVWARCPNALDISTQTSSSYWTDSLASIKGPSILQNHTFWAFPGLKINPKIVLLSHKMDASKHMAETHLVSDSEGATQRNLNANDPIPTLKPYRMATFFFLKRQCLIWN